MVRDRGHFRLPFSVPITRLSPTQQGEKGGARGKENTRGKTEAILCYRILRCSMMESEF
jgi:hypothetical protein